METLWIEVNVSPECIAVGASGDCFRCPVAIALGEATWENWGVMNDLVIHEPSGQTFQLPAAARRFVRAFDLDGRRNVEPFCFALELPRPFLPHLSDFQLLESVRLRAQQMTRKRSFR